MLIGFDVSGIPGFEGRIDAMSGEPLWPDAHPEYIKGWCQFHRIENPFTEQEMREARA